MTASLLDASALGTGDCVLVVSPNNIGAPGSTVQSAPVDVFLELAAPGENGGASG